MTCKDCIHNEVCHMREVCNDIDEQIKEFGCMDFIARADVQEVKHGEWEYIGTDKMGNVFRCSQCCGRIGLDKETDYCPNCGAKMDGGKNNA